MIQPRLRHLMVFILLISLLIGAGSGGYILCHDDDGRRHIEAAVTGSCGQADGPNGSVRPEIASHVDVDDSHCESCLDVDLSFDHLQQRLLSSAHLAPPGLPTQPVATFTLSPTLNAHLLASQSHRSPPAYLALRSTVLRC